MNNTLLVYTNRDQSEIIKRNLPVKSCEMIETGCYTDLIAISAFSLIIDSALLKPDELDKLHLHCDLTDPVLEVEQVIYLEDGTPLEYAHCHYRYDHGGIILVNNG